MSRRPESLRLGGGLAAWSVGHPVGVVMIALAVVVLGGFALQRLGVDLLPHIIYPEIRISVQDPGVPAKIMEDRVTRLLEEQLAITEGAVGIQSRTSEGRSSLFLGFPYGTDIDSALRDAGNRLDRSKRFLPETVELPAISKRDPSQIPVLQFVVSSPLQDAIELRDWVEYVFSKWFLNLPGVASTEVGGGLLREIQVLPDQHRLGGLGLDILDVVEALEQGNVDEPVGRLQMSRQEISGRTAGRFRDLNEIARLPIRLRGDPQETELLRLSEIAEILDGHEDERLRVRLNEVPGIKLSIQKQPQANTVAVVDVVNQRLEWLRAQGLIPRDVRVSRVDDQARFIRRAVNNAATAALSGALLAMIVVYLFLGNLRRTLVIGSAIPIAITITFILMSLGGLTLNIMTLGGLALGIGLLVDNTIVMLENIVRHQRGKNTGPRAAVRAAAEVNSAITASTTTNLAAVLPFLFVGGLVGLVFRELIFTISAAITASLVVALTLVPALAARIPPGSTSRARQRIDALVTATQRGYGRLLDRLLRVRWLVLGGFVAALVYTAPSFFSSKQVFLPRMDEGRVRFNITADPGVNLDELERAVTTIEELIREQPGVETWLTTVGGWVYGRSQFEAANRASISLQLGPLGPHGLESSDAWIDQLRTRLRDKPMAGVRVGIWTQAGVRGIRMGRGDEDVSVRIRGPNLETLRELGDEVVARLQGIRGLTTVQHSAENLQQELTIEIDRERATSLDLTVEDIGKAVRIALAGVEATEFIDGDRSIPVRVRLPSSEVATPEALQSVLLFTENETAAPVPLGDVARITLRPTPAGIQREQQQRIVEISASLSGSTTLEEVSQAIEERLADLQIPTGYARYDGGSMKTLQEGRRLSQQLLGLALFLVFVVMAVQYESLRNPAVILLSIPFAAIGVSLGLQWVGLPLSMPVWLGLIMLAGIVVNNAIVLVEHIEIERRRGGGIHDAIIEAARLRLRPILMTTLTTVVGMLPLAMALGRGSELLQPLAVTIVSGLSFSLLVSLLLVPLMYSLLVDGRSRPA